jgi:hypothetical protein
MLGVRLLWSVTSATEVCEAVENSFPVDQLNGNSRSPTIFEIGVDAFFGHLQSGRDTAGTTSFSQVPACGKDKMVIELVGNYPLLLASKGEMPCHL